MKGASLAEKIEKSLLDIDFAELTRRKFTPSPAAWEDQVLYFLLLDRFSDGKEKDGYRDNENRPHRTGVALLYSPADPGRVDYDVWLRAGSGWQGGTLQGLQSKLGYLRRLGITALWVSPIFRQVAFEPSYHGYGIQNFLDVDPHFGTRAEFRDFVQAAHEQGIYVILDIVAHHTGNVFSYNPDRYATHDAATGRWYNDPRWDGRPYAVQGLNDRDGRPTLPFDATPQAGDGNPGPLDAAWPDGAIWPREFQRADLFLRKGHITNWDYYPEYAEGDMFGLKTLNISVQWDGQYRKASTALACLALVYCFWIAYADLDGFRIDAAKHMGTETLRGFCDVIREFTQSIGKERFLLVGEIGGSRDYAWEVVEKTGLDAALGIEDVPGKLERMVTGNGDPADYFSLFRNWVLEEPIGHAGDWHIVPHAWYRNQVVTLVDDHDQIRKGDSKWRFCGDSRFRDLAFNVMAVQLTTLGIPCIYYGSEQGFDSGGRPNGTDLVLRESMFGGSFGGLVTQGRHFFNEDSELYRALAGLMDLRQKLLPLRRGRQALHHISGDGVHFGLPHREGDRMRSLVCWSRLFMDQEVVVAINTDEAQPVTAYSTVAPVFRAEGDQFDRIFWYAPKAVEPPPSLLTVERRNGPLAVRMTLPPAGFVIYQAAPGLARLGPNPPPGLKPWQPRES
jgi:glycosidase